MILNDEQIAQLGEGMIFPFVPASVRKNVVSFGLSSFGYDIRVGNKFRVFTPSLTSVSLVDPKNFKSELLREINDVKEVIIPANSYALGLSLEYFHIPVDVMALVVGKSTYARCGIIVNVTPLEPGWEGYVTIEISNCTPLPAKIYANEGIAQVLFFKGVAPQVNYATKEGKYQAQKDIVLPKVE